MDKNVFIGGTVFFPEAFLGSGMHLLECVLYPSAEAGDYKHSEYAALAVVCDALAISAAEVRTSQIGLPVIQIWYPAFRPCRLEFGAYEAARALQGCFGIPVNVLPAAVSLC